MDSYPAQSVVGQQTIQSQLNNPYLDLNQQDLLLAALNSQANGQQDTQPQTNGRGSLGGSFSESHQLQSNNMNGAFISPSEAEFDSFGDYTPELDYLDDGFDFENADLGGEMIGSLPGAGDSNEDLHEKRKSPDEKDLNDGSDAKRHESQDGEKGAKKPGRKPLTSEPTTVRCSRSTIVWLILT